MKADPRDKLGVPTPTEAFTGLAKRDTEPESIFQFAERHGWSVRTVDDASDGYFDTYRLTKDGQVADLTLWTTPRGRGKGEIALATLGGIELRLPHEVKKRERCEMFLTGVPCCCFVDPDLYSYERTPDPTCPIHGNPYVAAALTEQAAPEQLSATELARAPKGGGRET